MIFISSILLSSTKKQNSKDEKKSGNKNEKNEKALWQPGFQHRALLRSPATQRAHLIKINATSNQNQRNSQTTSNRYQRISATTQQVRQIHQAQLLRLLTGKSISQSNYKSVVILQHLFEILNRKVKTRICKPRIVSGLELNNILCLDLSNSKMQSSYSRMARIDTNTVKFKMIA